MNIAVFGATSEIGVHFIKSKINYFNHLILIGRNCDKLEQLVVDLKSPEKLLSFVLSDATDSVQMKKCIDIVFNQNFTIDTALYLIGYNNPSDFLNTSKEDFDEILKINLYSSFYFLSNILKKTKKTHLIVLSSTSGLEGYPSNSAYSAAKHGIIGLAKSIQSEYPNVLINVICPGLIKSESTIKNIYKQSENTNESCSDILLRLKKQNEWIELKDITDAVFTLITDTSEMELICRI